MKYQKFISVSETAEEWMERIGWCPHAPKCKDSAVCRALRAKMKPKPKPYKGEAVKPRKLDYED